MFFCGQRHGCFDVKKGACILYRYRAAPTCGIPVVRMQSHAVLRDRSCQVRTARHANAVTWTRVTCCVSVPKGFAFCQLREGCAMNWKFE